MNPIRKQAIDNTLEQLESTWKYVISQAFKISLIIWIYFAPLTIYGWVGAQPSNLLFAVWVSWVIIVGILHHIIYKIRKEERRLRQQNWEETNPHINKGPYL